MATKKAYRNKQVKCRVTYKTDKTARSVWQSFIHLPEGHMHSSTAAADAVRRKIGKPAKIVELQCYPTTQKRRK